MSSPFDRFGILVLTRGGIRTHEAEARDLKPRPFDRSGTRVCPPHAFEHMNFCLIEQMLYL